MDPRVKQFVGTTQAKAEMEARHRMAKEDEDRIKMGHVEWQAKLAEEEPDWSLYNYVLNIVSFKHIDTMRDAMHLMFRNLWPHIRRYHNERTVLIKYLKSMEGHPEEIKEIMDRPSPLAIAHDMLNKITEAARQRAKAKKYGIVAKKQGLVDGNAKL